jgi:hypothetical protein
MTTFDDFFVQYIDSVAKLCAKYRITKDEYIKGYIPWILKKNEKNDTKKVTDLLMRGFNKFMKEKFDEILK